LSTYQVRVQVSSPAVETSPWSSTSTTRPVPFAVSYFVVDLVYRHVPLDSRLKPRPVSVLVMTECVVPQLLVWVPV
jgi:hypothetical protein